MYQRIRLVLLILAVAGLIWINRSLELSLSSGSAKQEEAVVVLDAGHGGGDPGKVGVGDILEKDINLAIAQKVEAELEKEQVTVQMTRETDAMLAGDGAEANKQTDMKARVQCINEAAPKLAVSIHQNSYTDGTVSGAQVFYHTQSEKGKEAAFMIQEALLAVEPDNTRQAKANDTYYLLRKTTYPTVIVECGFLSNAEEAALLTEENYQQEMAEAIAQGILNVLEKG